MPRQLQRQIQRYQGIIIDEDVYASIIHQEGELLWEGEADEWEKVKRDVFFKRSQENIAILHLDEEKVEVL